MISEIIPLRLRKTWNEKEGVLVPLLVRTNPYGDGYEIISGHRRKEAAIWAGEKKVPIVIRELDDD